MILRLINVTIFWFFVLNDTYWRYDNDLHAILISVLPSTNTNVRKLQTEAAIGGVL